MAGSEQYDYRVEADTGDTTADSATADGFTAHVVSVKPAGGGSSLPVRLHSGQGRCRDRLLVGGRVVDDLRRSGRLPRPPRHVRLGHDRRGGGQPRLGRRVGGEHGDERLPADRRRRAGHVGHAGPGCRQRHVPGPGAGVRRGRPVSGRDGDRPGPGRLGVRPDRRAGRERLGPSRAQAGVHRRDLRQQPDTGQRQCRPHRLD